MTSINGDNCILSSEDVARLVNNNDVLVDDNWDLYQRVEGGYNCRGAQTGEEIISDLRLLLLLYSECYQLEHSLYKHYSSLGSSVTSQRARSLEACSAQCHQMARCETFSYGDAVYSGANCLLSDQQGAEISVSGDLVSDPGWAVYSLTRGGSQRCQQIDDTGQHTNT